MVDEALAADRFLAVLAHEAIVMPVLVVEADAFRAVLHRSHARRAFR